MQGQGAVKRPVPCHRLPLALQCGHERTGRFHSASLVAPAPVGADRAGGLESRKRLEERVSNRGSAGVGSLGGQHRCGGLSKHDNGHRRGHQPARTGVQASVRSRCKSCSAFARKRCSRTRPSESSIKIRRPARPEDSNAYSAAVPGSGGTCSCHVVFLPSVPQETARKIVLSLGPVPPT